MSGQWNPIQPLEDKDFRIDVSSVSSLYDSWRASKANLERSNPNGLTEFSAQLNRKLSVETGIIEKLYELDEGTTKTLVTSGFVEDLVSHEATNISPTRLIDILRDQESAIDLIAQAAKGERNLSKSLIHEIHAILTAHQSTTEAVDSLGRPVTVLLKRGIYKTLPNSRPREDATLEYCTPVHVEQEMDNLLSSLEAYRSVDPVLVASWLQHRFTQIHPYQDGNGRVSRALVTLVFLRAGLLPIVVDRSEKPQYLEALRAADDGELTPLVNLFAALQRRVILEALNFDSDKSAPLVATAAIKSLREKLQRRQEVKKSLLRQVNEVAITYRSTAVKVLAEPLKHLKASLEILGPSRASMQELGTDKSSGHYYRSQVIQSARENRRFVNFGENHYLLKVSAGVGGDRLVFIVSFHHTGKELSGIMEASAFAVIDYDEGAGTSEGVPSRDPTKPTEFPNVAENLVICTREPFLISNKSNVDNELARFNDWVNLAFGIAVTEFSNGI